MASAQVVETSVTNNSPSQDSYHPDDLFQSRYATLGFKPFSYKFKVGDQVKISKHKRVFEKSYLPNWSEETFTVAQRIARDPPVYKLKELDGELIKGTFYETELQKVIEPKDHLFRVEKFLRRRGKGG